MRKRNLNQAADRFYDYLLEHRSTVLRYLAVAVVSGLLHFLVSRMIPLESGVVIGFFLRFLLLFYGAKYWVYREQGSGFFYTARQLMIAVMAVTVLTVAVNYLTIFLGNRLWISYLLQGIYEIVLFFLFQLLIFKQED